MKYCSLAVLLTFSLMVFADDVIIYRWVDENNIAHFSQNQPATGDYTEIIMASANSSTTERDTSSSQLNNPEVKKPGVKKEVQVDNNRPKENDKECEEAKKNLATLKDFDRVRFVDANGETQILDEAKQAEQIKINEEHIKAFCTSK
mgnify:CR=1 FL=1